MIYHQRTVRAALVGACATAAAAQTPPLFGPVWTAPFNQSITIYSYTWSNVVQFFYDSTTRPVGSSLYVHSLGQHDELCTSVVGHELSDEPCNLIASSDTWRYIYFPQNKGPFQTCCRACNTTDYCGIISPTWLQQNSTYVGERTIDGSLCQGWEKTGGEENYYFATPGAQQPCQYYEGYPTFDIGNNTWTFLQSQFSRAPIPGSTFDVPTGVGCEQMCATSSMTYRERLAARHAAGLTGLRSVGN